MLGRSAKNNTHMKILIFTLFSIISHIHCFAESPESIASKKQLTQLIEKSHLIDKSSSEKDVELLLGKPQYKGFDGWMNMSCTVWTYLNYSDDSTFRHFRVLFDPKTGCSMSHIENHRKNLLTKPIIISSGTVTGITTKSSKKGFLCSVRFNDHKMGEGFTIGVAVASLDRVSGTLEIGSTILIKHRGSEYNYIFLGGSQISLESITLKKMQNKAQ
jgi:hypothetical protein